MSGAGFRVTCRERVVLTLVVLVAPAMAGSGWAADGPKVPARSQAEPWRAAQGDEPPADSPGAPQDPAAPPASPAPEPTAPDLVIKAFGDINLAYQDDGTPGGFSLGIWTRREQSASRPACRFLSSSMSRALNMAFQISVGRS